MQQVQSRQRQGEELHVREAAAAPGETARKVCPTPTADLFADRAGRIDESLEIGIALHRGESIVPAG
jgi:hypothetical protein